MGAKIRRKTGDSRRTSQTAAPALIQQLEPRTLMAAAPLIPAPSNVAVTTVSEAQLSLAWSDNSAGETQFVLERAAGSGRFVQVAALPAGTTSFNDSGLMPLTSYRYRVRATTDTLPSKWS